MAEPDPEPADLRALRLLLRQSKDFRLAIALYNDSVRRDGWIRSLADDIGKEGVRVLTLDLLHDKDRGRSLLERVQALAAGVPPGERTAIMVVNMERLVDYAPELSRPGGPGPAFLDTANLHRELFPKACPGPLVLWMTEMLEQAFIRCAPDLWSWRNHVFDLRTRTAPEAPTFDEYGRPYRSDDHRLHPVTRLRRLEEELAAFRRTGSRKDEMRVLNAIGLARLDAGDAKTARLDFEAALQIALEIGDRRGEGIALGNLGNAHAALGDARKAIGYHEQALAVSREIGDRRAEGQDLGNLGNAHFDLGDARKAIGYHEQALAVSREIGDVRGEATDLWNAALAHDSLGNRAGAIAGAAAALAIYEAIEDPAAAQVRAKLEEWRG